MDANEKMDNKKAVKLNKKHVIIMSVSGLMLVSLLLVLVGITQSRFRLDNRDDAKGTLEEFYAAARLYTTEGGTRTEIPVQEDANGRHYYEVQADKFETLSMDISYQGKARTYMRFKFDTSWYHIKNGREELIFHKYPEYTFNDQLSIYNNQQKDNYIYFENVIDTGSEAETVYPVITSVRDLGDFQDPITNTDQSTNVRIYITVDCVQYNRAKVLWNMTRFPWEE